MLKWQLPFMLKSSYDNSRSNPYFLSKFLNACFCAVSKSHGLGTGPKQVGIDRVGIFDSCAAVLLLD